MTRDMNLIPPANWAPLENLAHPGATTAHATAGQFVVVAMPVPQGSVSASQAAKPPSPPAAPPVAPPVGPPTIADQLVTYTKWNEWLVAGGGFVRTAAGVAAKFMKPSSAMYNDVMAAMQALYLAVKDMNDAVVSGIKSLQAGKMPTVTFDPINLPDWPVGASPGIVTSAWTTVQPILQQVDTAMLAKYPGNPMVVALGGLVNAGANLIPVLQHYFPND